MQVCERCGQPIIYDEWETCHRDLCVFCEEETAIDKQGIKNTIQGILDLKNDEIRADEIRAVV